MTRGSGASWFETPAFALAGCGGLLTMRVQHLATTLQRTSS
jgi:hypothetical protein